MKIAIIFLISFLKVWAADNDNQDSDHDSKNNTLINRHKHTQSLPTDLPNVPPSPMNAVTKPVIKLDEKGNNLLQKRKERKEKKNKKKVSQDE